MANEQSCHTCLCVVHARCGFASSCGCGGCYDAAGRLLPSLQGSDSYLTECGPSCSCDPAACMSRVTQGGVRVAMAIVKSSKKVRSRDIRSQSCMSDLFRLCKVFSVPHQINPAGLCSTLVGNIMYQRFQN